MRTRLKLAEAAACATKAPSLSPNSKYGRKRRYCSAESAGMFTALRINPSARYSRTCSAINVPTSSCASAVEPAICGVAIKFGNPINGEFFGGSVANVSTAAPDKCPERKASASAASSINSPRAQLISRAPFFICANAAAFIIFSVAALSAVCSEITSERFSKSSSETSSTSSSRAAAGVTYGSYASTFISSARARRATSDPTRPSPTNPSVFPRNSIPEEVFSQRPACIEAFDCGTLRASPSSSANVCSATLTAFPPGVFITSTPRCVAASISTLSTPTPARPTTRNFSARSSKSRVTFVALRTTSPSAFAISPASAAAAGSTISQPVSRKSAIPRSLILSATIIFISSSVAAHSQRVKCVVRIRRILFALGARRETKSLCYSGPQIGGRRMGYIDRIQSDLTAAMKEKDELRLSVLRMVKSALKLKEIDKMRPLDDMESLQVLQTLVKQRKESIEQFTQGGRQDLADKEAKEIKIIEQYLPAAPSDGEMRRAIEEAVSESGADSLKQMGAVVKAARAKLEGKAVDGKALSDKVRERLTEKAAGKQ